MRLLDLSVFALLSSAAAVNTQDLIRSTLTPKPLNTIQPGHRATANGLVFDTKNALVDAKFEKGRLSQADRDACLKALPGLRRQMALQQKQNDLPGARSTSEQINRIRQRLRQK